MATVPHVLSPQQLRRCQSQERLCSAGCWCWEDRKEGDEARRCGVHHGRHGGDGHRQTLLNDGRNSLKVGSTAQAIKRSRISTHPPSSGYSL